MNRLIIFVSSLGAVFPLALVSIGVLESVAFDFKEALGRFYPTHAAM